MAAPTTESDEDWVANKRYFGLSAVDAAADPRTPEKYLLQSAPRSLEQYLALTGRPNLSRHMTRRLIWWAEVWGGERSDHPAVIAAALTLPGVTAADLENIAVAMRPVPGADTAVAAIAAHPASTNKAVAWALESACFGNDMGKARQAAALLGSFVPYARTLHRQGAGLTGSLGGLIDSIVDMADSIDALFTDPGTRRAAAAVSLGFTGSPQMLAQVVHAAAQPATAPAVA